MKSDGDGAAGPYALEVVSIRDHGVTCRVTSGPLGGFTTLPTHLVESALAAAGRRLEPGAHLCLSLSADVPATSRGERPFAAPDPTAHPAGDQAFQYEGAPRNGNHA